MSTITVSAERGEPYKLERKHGYIRISRYGTRDGATFRTRLPVGRADIVPLCNALIDLLENDGPA